MEKSWWWTTTRISARWCASPCRRPATPRSARERQAGAGLLRPRAAGAVVLDILMPEMDGTEVCAPARRAGHRAHADPVRLQQGRRGRPHRRPGAGRRRLRRQAVLAARAGGAGARHPAPCYPVPAQAQQALSHGACGSTWIATRPTGRQAGGADPDRVRHPAHPDRTAGQSVQPRSPDEHRPTSCTRSSATDHRQPRAARVRAKSARWVPTGGNAAWCRLPAGACE